MEDKTIFEIPLTSNEAIKITKATCLELQKILLLQECLELVLEFVNHDGNFFHGIVNASLRVTREWRKGCSTEGVMKDNLDLESVASEIADVLLMITQISKNLNLDSLIQDKLKFKKNRLVERMKEEGVELHD
jgi:NTP pyrophosphatase (non-canonical NTP hydrolase)